VVISTSEELSAMKLEVVGCTSILVTTYEQIYGVIIQKIMVINQISSREKSRLKSVEMKLLSNSRIYLFSVV
jgi:hypothetical protein